MSIKSLHNRLASKAVTIRSTHFDSHPKSQLGRRFELSTKKTFVGKHVHVAAALSPHITTAQQRSCLLTNQRENERHNNIVPFYVISTNQVLNHFPTMFRAHRLRWQSYPRQTPLGDCKWRQTQCANTIVVWLWRLRRQQHTTMLRAVTIQRYCTMKQEQNK